MPQSPAAPGLERNGDERQAVVSGVQHLPAGSGGALAMLSVPAAVAAKQGPGDNGFSVIRKSKYILFIAKRPCA